jgi:hypothetical protein
MPTAGTENCSSYARVCEIGLFTRKKLHVGYRIRFLTFLVKTLVVHSMVMQYCQPLLVIYGVFLVFVLRSSY